MSRLANMTAALYQSDPHISWAGFYTIDAHDDAWLSIFQGKPACMKIPAGKGVIGHTVKIKHWTCVSDVAVFPGHVACDPDSRSELVIPLYKEGLLFAVLDLDADITGRFDGWPTEFIAGLQKLFSRTAGEVL